MTTRYYCGKGDRDEQSHDDDNDVTVIREMGVNIVTITTTMLL